MKTLVTMVLTSAAAAGCTSTRISSVETGLFENNPLKIAEAYEALEKKKFSGAALTVNDLEVAGFKLKAPNIESVPGTLAFKRIFGDTVFCDKNGVEKLDPNLDAKYRGYLIPYQRIETVSDRAYISEYEVFRKGTQMQIFLLFNNDKLCYCEFQRSRIDTYYSHYSLFEGLLIMIKSPGRAALELIEKLEEYQKPGLQYFVPIPIP